MIVIKTNDNYPAHEMYCGKIEKKQQFSLEQPEGFPFLIFNVMFCVVDAQQIGAVLNLNAGGRWCSVSVHGNQWDIQYHIWAKTQKIT